MLFYLFIFAIAEYFMKKRGILNPLYSVYFVFIALLNEIVCSFTSDFFLVGGVSSAYSGDAPILALIIQLFVNLPSVFLAIFTAYILQKKYDHRSYYKKSKTHFKTIGKIIILLGVLKVIVSIFLVSQDFSYSKKGIANAIIGTILLTIFGSRSCFKYHRQQLASNRSIDLIESKHPPLIFLRSFSLATIELNYETFDDLIAKGVPNEIPFISLGNPDDFLPTTGSIKIQAKDESWEEVVIHLMKGSRGVILCEGISEGVKTEIENLLKYVSPEKVFVITATKKFRKEFIKNIKSKDIWKHFSLLMKQYGITLPVNDPGNGCIYSFNENWEAKLIAKNGKTGSDFIEKILENTTQFDSELFNYKELYNNITQYTIEEKRTLPIQKINVFKVYLASTLVSIASLFLLLFLFFGLFGTKKYANLNNYHFGISDNQIWNQLKSEKISLPIAVDSTTSWVDIKFEDDSRVIEYIFKLNDGYQYNIKNTEDQLFSAITSEFSSHLDAGITIKYTYLEEGNIQQSIKVNPDRTYKLLANFNDQEIALIRFENLFRHKSFPFEEQTGVNFDGININKDRHIIELSYTLQNGYSFATSNIPTIRQNLINLYKQTLNAGFIMRFIYHEENGAVHTIEIMPNDIK